MALVVPLTSFGGPSVTADWERISPEPGASPIERVARRVPLPGRCEDRRYPRLVGTFIAHCGPSGRVDRALDLSTGETVVLAGGPRAWGVADNEMYGLGRAGGTWKLPAPTPTGADDLVHDAVTPAGFDGKYVSYGARTQVALFIAGERTRRTWVAHPAPWYPPAVRGPQTWWVELQPDGAPTILTVGDAHGEPTAWTDEPAHHPVAAGDHLAWVERGDVLVADLQAQTITRYEADAGFESPPAVAGESVCWGDRTSGFTARCTDGWSAPGRRPSGGGPLVLVHSELIPTLYVAQRWPLTVTDGVVEVAPWWGTGTVEVWADGTRVDQVELALGERATIAVPDGVLVEARPLDPLPRGLR
jgi:hypothetical protein